MARPKGSKNKQTRKQRRSAYETYEYWVERYGGHKLSKKEFEQARELKKLELQEQGKSTTNLSRTLAQESSFTYDYRTGRAIKKAYAEMFDKDISISEARNIMQYTKQTKEALRREIDEDFWMSVSDYYNELKNTGVGSREARDVISETIFGSP